MECCSESPPHSTLTAPTVVSARWREWTLLFALSIAQAMDIFNLTAPTIALPYIVSDLEISNGAKQWVVTAYSLTFGAFMLMGGRISALYGHKRTFLGGFSVVGLCALINGFAVNGPMLYVFRAFQGIGASLTIPSALAIITFMFPTPGEQDLAIGIFAGIGALGGTFGVIIGGIIAQFLTWRWIFWIMAMIISVINIATLSLAPSPPRPTRTPTIQSLDFLGLAIITSAFLLFIYSVTEGNTRGWKTGGVLAPLVISVLLVPLFAYVETKVPDPLIPPVVWTLPHFVPLFLITTSQYLVLNVLTFELSQVFQLVWGTSAVSAAIRFLPFGITVICTTVLSSHITPHVSPRWILSVGQTFMCCGALLLTFAPTIDRYWTRVVPGLVLLGLGCASGFVASNIGLLRTPLGKPSVKLEESNALIGAIFNADLQLGSATGLAIATAISDQINAEKSSSDFQGYRGALFFIVGLCALESVLALTALRSSNRYIF